MTKRPACPVPMRGLPLSFIRAIAGTVIVLGGLTACSSPAQQGRVVLAEPAPPRTVYQKNELLHDVDYLMTTVHQVHPNPYHRVDSARIAEARAVVEASLVDGMSGVEFWRVLAPFVALFRDGHTSIGRPPDGVLDSLFPLVIRLDSTAVNVRTDLSDEAVFGAGARIERINGIAVEDLVRDGTTFFSFERDELRRVALERGWAGMLPLIRGWSGPFAVEGTRADGVPVAATLSAIRADTWRARVEEGGLGAQASEPYEFRWLSDDVAYIDFRSHTDPDRFDDFLKHTFRALRDGSPCALVLDLRWNGGGSAELSDRLLTYLSDRPIRQYSRLVVRASAQVKEMHRARLPRLLRRMPAWFFAPFDRDFAALLGGSDGALVSWTREEEAPGRNELRYEGPLFVLIGTNTFSAASDLAAALKDYGIGALVGSETGGLASSYGEYYRSALPNTRLPLNVSFKYFVRPAGYDDGTGVQPDVFRRASGSAAGEDPVLLHTIQLARDGCSQAGDGSAARARFRHDPRPLARFEIGR
jgi:hypothetical protein